MKLSMFRDGVELWSELEPLAKNLTATFQTLAAGEGERFFGGGMQNGRWSHAGQKIRISVDYNWDDGGNPNAAPFYLSTAGYGVYRNTWAPGYYDFAEELGAPAPGAQRMVFKWVESEQKLPGTSHKRAKESRAGYLGWSKKFREVFGFDPPPK